ncbi:hypothetical protein niasHT_018109 [Heterodera trifolii]|uniref:Fido domain-containing protein n=1 Tax=Heterodera trifolii TaxID=157864 RepID=A0ABD2LD91_9BILA
MPRDVFDIEKEQPIQRGTEAQRARHMERSASATPFKKDKLIKLHWDIMEMDEPGNDIGGQIRTSEVEVNGEPMLHSDHVPDALERFVKWFNCEEKTTQNSVIHPAEDGNWRLCRLLINLILKLGASRASRSLRIGELNITMFSSGPTEPFAQQIEDLVEEKKKKK